MPNEGKLATKMRQEGRICCLCRIPLAPPHPIAERFCAKCGVPHRVYLHASQYSNLWFVQFLEEDLRTSFCGNLTYSTLDEIREVLRRFKVSVDQGEEFESGIRRWSIGACFVTLTPRQYAALKTKFPTKGA
jgi:hypothetical protein